MPRRRARRRTAQAPDPADRGTFLFLGRTFLTLLIVALGLVVAPVSAASADPTLFGTVDACLGTAPVPQDPAANGYMSSLIPRPEDYKPADAFTDPSTSILEQYGSAGMFWSTYDNGCQAGSDFLPSTWANLANFGTTFSKASIGLTTMLGDATLNPLWLAAADGPVAAVGQALWKSVAQPWMWVLILVAAAVIIASAFKARIGKAVGATLFVCLALCIVALPFKQTGALTGLFDHTVAGGATYALSGGATGPSAPSNPGIKIMAQTYDVAEYQRWVEGELCSATSPSAKEYGPRLFKAQAFTWDESAKANASPDAYAAAVAAKQADWTAVAAEVKAKDPVAYQCLTGNRGDVRMGAALLSNFVTVATLPFLLTVLFMLLGAYLIIRFLVGYSPVIGTLLVLPAMHGMARTVMSIIAACFVNVLVYAAAGYSIVATSNALLTAPGINQLLACVLIAAMSVIAWIFLRPFRTLTRIAKNPGDALQATFDAPGDALNAVKKLAGGAALAGAGSMLGNVAAMKWNRKHRDDDDPDDDAIVQDVPADTDEPGEDTGVWMYAQPQTAQAIEGRTVPGPAVTGRAAPAGAALPEAPIQGEVVPEEQPQGEVYTAHRYAYPQPAGQVAGALPAGTTPQEAPANDKGDEGADAHVVTPPDGPSVKPAQAPDEPPLDAQLDDPTLEPGFDPADVVIGESVIPDSPDIAADVDDDLWLVLDEPQGTPELAGGPEVDGPEAEL